MGFEPIVYNMWPSLAPVQWSGGPLPPSGLIYVGMEEIPAFFNALEESDKEYTLVTGASDYTVVYQRDFPPQLDMINWLKNFETFEFYKTLPINGYYSTISLEPRMVKENCYPGDKYSIKMYSFTLGTFDDIPPNIKHWYCVNNDMDDKRVTQLPFGLPNWTLKLITEKRKGINSWSEIRKTRKLEMYRNFQINTAERAKLAEPYLTESEVSHEQYIDSMSQYIECMCPSGNGADSFRISECLMLGVTPFVVYRGRGNWVRGYGELRKYMAITNDIGNAVMFDGNVPYDLSGTSLDMNYWREIIC